MPNLISLHNVCLIVGLFVVLSNGFPDGAPPDTCVKDRFNQPNHGKARSQELSTLPFQVVASSAYYGPGQSISCKQTKHINLTLHVVFMLIIKYLD